MRKVLALADVQICMWMEPFSAFVLTAMQRVPSPLNLEDSQVIQIKAIPINGWGMEHPD